MNTNKRQYPIPVFSFTYRDFPLLIAKLFTLVPLNGTTAPPASVTQRSVTCAYMCAYVFIHMSACMHAWIYACIHVYMHRERDIAQMVEHPPLKVKIIWSILYSGCICSLGYFPFQPVVYNWSIKDCSTHSPIGGIVHIKDPLLLIRMSNLFEDSRFSLKKYVTMTIGLSFNSR